MTREIRKADGLSKFVALSNYSAGLPLADSANFREFWLLTDFRVGHRIFGKVESLTHAQLAARRDYNGYKQFRIFSMQHNGILHDS